MGGGSWDTDVYVSSATTRAASGTSDFGYTDDVLTTKPRDEWKAHETLDPYGVISRESRDSDEHPTSVAIAVMFDVTGSMHTIPRVLQKKLPDLLERLLTNGYVPDPQVLFGAFADIRARDPIPVQVSQFESDNRMDEHLRNIALTGGGGGTSEESYELVLYFFARHTSIDCWEKRSRKGYLFIIGDEMPYPEVRAQDVDKVFGEKLMQNIPTEEIMAEVTEMYHVVYVIPRNASHGDDQRVIGRWESLIGSQNVLRPETVDDIAMTIATWVGNVEQAYEDEAEDETEEPEVAAATP